MKLASKLLCPVAVIGALMSGFVATAQAKYPDRVVTLVVPFGAGGGADQTARLMSTAGYEEGIWGKGLRVRNIPGASGIQGWKWVLEQPSDGYTVLLGTSTPVLALLRESKPILDPTTDIKICALIGYFRPDIMIQKNKPYHDLKSLLAYAKKNPGEVTVGGTASNLLGAAILFKQLGVTMNYVPYPGTGAALADFVGKHIDIFVGPDEIVQTFAPEKASVIATASNKPNPKGFEKGVGNTVPQPKDLGLSDSFEGLRWIGVRPNTPDSICKAISDSVGKTLEYKPVKKMMKKLQVQSAFTPMKQAQKDYLRMIRAAREAIIVVWGNKSSK